MPLRAPWRRRRDDRSGESSRRGEAPRSVRRWCEDFASRAGTYPFPLRTPAHGVAGSTEKDALRRSSTPGTGF
jgi:hypothetical protein